jgi:hypothetical protein
MSTATNPTPEGPTSLSSAEITERHWMRFPADEARVYLYVSGGKEIPALVRDESFGGIGVLVDNAPAEFVPGFALEVEYAGAPMAALIRRVNQQDDGRTFLGLEWA